MQTSPLGTYSQPGRAQCAPPRGQVEDALDSCIIGNNTTWATPSTSTNNDTATCALPGPAQCKPPSGQVEDALHSCTINNKTSPPTANNNTTTCATASTNTATNDNATAPTPTTTTAPQPKGMQITQTIGIGSISSGQISGMGYGQWPGQLPGQPYGYMSDGSSSTTPPLSNHPPVRQTQPPSTAAQLQNCMLIP